MPVSRCRLLAWIASWTPASRLRISKQGVRVAEVFGSNRCEMIEFKLRASKPLMFACSAAG